jgi:LmbE family N-acetylglucosaminyl deacetylase
MVSRRTAIAMGAALLALILLLAPGASGATKTCGAKVLYVAAHEDDTLLFQSPDLLEDVKSGRCVRTVFLTAGDAGKAQSYWSSREAGAEAAYAQMAGLSNQWTESQVLANGHALTLKTLDEEPGISIVYLRLPDGGTNGKGFPAYGEQSLVKLWRGGNPGKGSPTISSITSVDGASTYGYGDLIETLEQLMASYQPRLIATQNFNDGLFEGDHPDHTATAYFAKLAEEGYAQPHRLLAYGGYQIASLPANVSDEPLGAKSFAFYAYGLHDPGACSDALSCSSTIYASWLQRQYVTGARTVGAVADAGALQETTTGAAVTLDGSASSSEGGGPLSYEWVQMKGPRVSLADADTATPSFKAPNHPTLLTFSLVVSDGELRSEPAFVTVRVPSSDPSPVAVAGSVQEVDSGAAVGLDGSESYDPNSEELEYAWIQTGGPLVSLSDPGTPEPTFAAPVGPTTLTFSLVVSNGEQTSAPATQVVTVKGIAPAFSSDGEAEFAVGGEGVFTVRAEGSPPPAISVAEGSLPIGLVLHDSGDGTATISGSPAEDSAPPGGITAYPLTLLAQNSAGLASQELTLTVRRDPLPPPPTPTPRPSLPPEREPEHPPVGGSDAPGELPPTPVVRERLDRARVTLPAVLPSRKIVKVVGAAGVLGCDGRVPPRVSCRVQGDAVVVRSRGGLKAPATYRLQVTVADAEGLLRLTLAVRVQGPR